MTAEGKERKEHTPHDEHYSPGPWKVSDWGGTTIRDRDGAPVAILDFEKRTMAVMFGDLNADARLIAAAPELLRAARNVVSAAMENSRATYEVAGGPFEDLVDAIAKAEGNNE